MVYKTTVPKVKIFYKVDRLALMRRENRSFRDTRIKLKM